MKTLYLRLTSEPCLAAYAFSIDTGCFSCQIGVPSLVSSLDPPPVPLLGTLAPFASLASFLSTTVPFGLSSAALHSPFQPETCLRPMASSPLAWLHPGSSRFTSFTSFSEAIII